MPKLNLDDVDVTEDPKPGADDGQTDDESTDPPEGDDDQLQEEGDGADTEGGATDEAGDDVADDAGDLIVTIGDEPAEDDDHRAAPDWVRKLRQGNREKDRLLRERDAEIARLKGSAAAPAPLGEKPKLADFAYDDDAYETALDAWKDRKREIEDQAAARQRAESDAKAAWQKTLEGYNKAKAALKVRDFDDAEAVVQDLLDTTQQGIIVAGATDPATVIYALGKNPKKAAELAGIKDPVKFAFAVAEVQSKMKVQPRKQVPPPERTLRSGVAGAAAVDNTLDKLRAEALKTGDLSKVLAYKNGQRQKASARA